MLIDNQKKFRDRANRSKRALLKEQKDFGFISDGSGKRYRVNVDYISSGDVEKADEFTRWFEEQFPDDGGEPVFLLYSAITYFRLQDQKKARRYLLDAMLSNVYLLPALFFKPISRLDMWHSSNWDTPEYVDEIREYLSEPNAEERAWFQEEFEGHLFTEVRNKYVAAYRALQSERDVGARGQILDDWLNFESDVRANEI